MHQRPEAELVVNFRLAPWRACRAVCFANQVSASVGRKTPASYPARWRVGLVQKVLRMPNPLRLIAEEAGYRAANLRCRAPQVASAELITHGVVEAERLFGVKLGSDERRYCPQAFTCPTPTSSTAHCAEHPLVQFNPD